MATKDEGFLLDGSGKRVLSGSGEAVRTGSYDDEEVTQNRMKAAKEKLARDVQKKLKDDSDSARVSKDAEQGAKAPTSSAKASDGMDDSDRRREAAASAPKRMPTRPGQGAKPKSKIVTKEQLAKSGFDNLRDYMNAEKGLKRRDGSKIEKAPSKTTTETKPAGSMAKADKPAGASGIIDPQQKAQQKTQPSEPAANKAKSAASGSSKPEPYNPLAVRFFKSLRARGEKDLTERGMKKGGSVSSASKRADGIAQRGKTRGKVY